MLCAFASSEDVESLKAKEPAPLSRRHPVLSIILKLLAGAAAGVILVILGQFIIFWLG